MIVYFDTSAIVPLLVAEPASANCRTLWESADELWPEFQVVEVDVDLMHRAADLAARQGLRGYDAVHCAAADLIADADTVAASGDRALLDAWSALGIATFDPQGRRPTTGQALR